MSKVRCLHFSEVSDRCAKCKAVHIDWRESLNENYKWYREQAGYCYGKGNVAGAARWGESFMRYVEVVESGVPVCEHSDYTEGRYKSMKLMPCERKLIYGEE